MGGISQLEMTPTPRGEAAGPVKPGSYVGRSKLTYPYPPPMSKLGKRNTSLREIEGHRVAGHREKTDIVKL